MPKPSNRAASASQRYVSTEQFETLQRQMLEMGLAVKESSQVNTLERYLDGLVGSLGEYLAPLRVIMPRAERAGGARERALANIRRSLAAPNWAGVPSEEFELAGLREPPIIGAMEADACREESFARDDDYSRSYEPDRDTSYESGRTAQ